MRAGKGKPRLTRGSRAWAACLAAAAAILAAGLLAPQAGAVTYSSTDVPMLLGDAAFKTNASATTIPDVGTVESQNEVAVPGYVAEVRVGDFRFAHNWPADLDVALRSPSGTVVELFGDRCFNEPWTADNTNFALLDNPALPEIPADPAAAGCPPEGNAYRPQGDLSEFVGEPIAGTWTLIVTDDEELVTGQLLNWSIAVLPQARSQLTVLGGPTVRSLAVRNLRLTHTWPGDLEFVLRSPSGTEVQLLSRVCGGEDWTGQNTGFSLLTGAGAVFDANPNGPSCPPGARSFQAVGDLREFDGEPSSGNWQLRITDHALADTGQLLGWSLQMADPPPPPPPVGKVKFGVPSPTFAKRGLLLQVKRLKLTKITKGAKIGVSCKGDRCPFKSRPVKVKKGGADLTGLFKKRFMGPKTTIEIRGTATGKIGRVVIFSIAKGTVKKTERCLAPGASKPKKCGEIAAS